MGVFKGFLSHALHLRSEKNLVPDVKLLINVFAEKGHSITVLEKYLSSITSIKKIQTQLRMNKQ